MLRKFINGLVFGAGFAISLIVVSMLWGILEVFFSSGKNLAPDVAPLTHEQGADLPKISNSRNRYHGSVGHYKSGFNSRSTSVLKTGNSELFGSITGPEGNAIVGLTLRLGINDNVYSEWVTTDAAGIYRVSVPAGVYRIDGYSLQSRSADKALSGLTDPSLPFSLRGTGEFAVAEGASEHALSLQFINLIKKVPKPRLVTLDELPYLQWVPLANATMYRLSFFKIDPDGSSHRIPFGTGDDIDLDRPSIDLNRYSTFFETGLSYQYHITARDQSGQIIGRTHGSLSQYDFRILPNKSQQSDD